MDAKNFPQYAYCKECDGVSQINWDMMSGGGAVNPDFRGDPAPEAVCSDCHSIIATFFSPTVK